MESVDSTISFSVNQRLSVCVKPTADFLHWLKRFTEYWWIVDVQQ